LLMFVRMQTSTGTAKGGPASAIRGECISFLGLLRNGDTLQQCAAWEIVRISGFFRLYAPVHPGVRRCASSRRYRSNEKMRFQSFFMLITIQPFLFASVINASEKVPT
jgi:hypothetical protein